MEVGVRVLFVQFEEDDGPGLLGEGLADLGARCDVVRPYEGDAVPSPDGVDGLVVLGGAMNAEQDAEHPYLPAVVLALRDAHRGGIPTLGVCLGGQLLARALGARVWRKDAPEVGYFPIDFTAAGRADPLFRDLPSPFLTLQWHEDAFDLPAGATLLADSRRDTLQAYRSGWSYGVQFHPEVRTHEVAAWSRAAAAMLTQAADPTTAEALLRRCRETEAAFAAQTAKLCRNLAAIVKARMVQRMSLAWSCHEKWRRP
jgi:GMP synthase-like glutamine amidotransferase